MCAVSLSDKERPGGPLAIAGIVIGALSALGSLLWLILLLTARPSYSF
jgi:hypothetical protein